MLNTPGGRPAASTISAKTSPDSGATSDGFSTIVQPASSAGATLSAIWFIGQFHGVMRPTTPIGSWKIRSPGACGPSGRSQSMSFAAAMNPSKCQSPEVTCCSRDQSMGAPISALIACAMSSDRLR